MRRHGRSEFTNSAKTELFDYRKRKRARIDLYLQLDAQSKKRQNDPPEGKITVLIHGGDEIDRRWSAYRDELEAWESVVAGLLD